MDSEILYRLTFEGPAGQTDMALELFATVKLNLSARTEVARGVTVYELYAENEADMLDAERTLLALRPVLEENGVAFGPTQRDTIKKEDWTETWKRHFKPQKVSPTLVIKATWLEYVPENDELIIEIDPKMSFGTGSHETTRFCLKTLETLARDPGPKRSFLDAGCGSGVLAITAAKLGYAPVRAFDNDPEAIENSRENAARNGLGPDEVVWSVSDLVGFNPERRYDVVAANIISAALIGNRDRILSWVKPGGKLILAGVLAPEADALVQAFSVPGVTLEDSETEKDWTGFLFRVAPLAMDATAR